MRLKKPNKVTGIVILALLAVTGGCRFSDGQRPLTSRTAHVRASISACLTCHTSSNSADLDPLVSGGTGTRGKHDKHVRERGIACEGCHAGYMQRSTHMNGTRDILDASVSVVSFSIVGSGASWVNDAGPQTGSCSAVPCHGSDAVDWYGTATWTTPSACTTCHTAPGTAPDPMVTNGSGTAGKHVRHVASRSIDCERCHNGYAARASHMNGALEDSTTAANVISLNFSGPTGSWTRDASSKSGSCTFIACHGPETLQWYGSDTWSSPTTCTICHSTAFSSALDPLITNGTGSAGRHVRHVSSLGYTCSKCHKDYTARNSHSNGTFDTANAAVLILGFDATNPTGTWTDDAGLETGRCSSLACHGADTLVWYGTAGWTACATTTCHGSSLGVRRQVTGTAGDFASNPSISSHHVAGTNDPTSMQCLVCHDISHHMAGTVHLKNADTSAGIAYDPSTPSSLEPFCLSCHDVNGAAGNKSPFADGKTLGVVPNTAGEKIAGYWTASFTVHRSSGLTCAGSGAPGTGCHGSNRTINMHGSVSMGLLTRNVTLPVPNGSAYDYNQYKLCFDCHANYPAVTKEVVLGYKQGGNYDVWWAPSPYSTPTTTIRSLFRDRYISAPGGYPAYWGGTNQLYNDSIWGDTFTPLHNYHLSPDDGGMQGIWNYRGNASANGRATCTTCHNVHGTNNSVRSAYDEFGITRATGTGDDLYSSLVPTTNYSDAVLKAFPINCTVSCHGIVPETHYWHTPANE